MGTRKIMEHSENSRDSSVFEESINKEEKSDHDDVKRKSCISKCQFSVHHWVIFFLLLMGFSGILGLSIYIPLNWKSKDCRDVYPHTGRTSEHSGLYHNAGVAADSGVCSALGTKIMRKGGNAVDSAIVTVLCSGIQNFHSCGVGGGSFMMITDENNDVREFINCVKKAPAAAFEEMFVEGTGNSPTTGS